MEMEMESRLSLRWTVEIYLFRLHKKFYTRGFAIVIWKHVGIANIGNDDV